MNIKKIHIVISLLALSGLIGGCKKEAALQSSPEAGFEQLFKPAADAYPQEKWIYDTYGVWVRMDFKDSKEVYNSYLGQDVNNARFPAVKVDEADRPSAYQYMDTLLGNTTVNFSKALMPNEIFFVKTYGHPAWGYQFNVVARNRLAFVWPNETYGSQPVTDPAIHYYKDSALTREVWRNLCDMIGDRLTDEIAGFEKIGKPYDNGAAFVKVRDQYFIDYDLEKRNREWQKIADQGGYLDAYASFSYKAEFSGWMQLILTESYDNIYEWYLKNNAMRMDKYKLFIKYFQEQFDWDIQATGNKYRKLLNQYN